MRRITGKKKAVIRTCGFFSNELTTELHTILADDFNRDIKDKAELQEVGLRLVEFVLAKERRKQMTDD